MLVTTLEPVEEPDHIELHVADRCTVCGATLKDVEAENHQRPQVSGTFRTAGRAYSGSVYSIRWLCGIVV